MLYILKNPFLVFCYPSSTSETGNLSLTVPMYSSPSMSFLGGDIVDGNKKALKTLSDAPDGQCPY